MRYNYYTDLMFLNGNKWDRYFTSSPDEGTTYDAIVIGSGMGGGTLADSLSNLGMNTLLLEAGPLRHLANITDLPLPSTVEAFDPYDLERGTKLTGGVCFNLGGRSIYWSAVIPRMQGWELMHWPEAIRTYLTDRGYDDAETHMRKRAYYPTFQNRLVGAFQSCFGLVEGRNETTAEYHRRLIAEDRYSVDHLPRSLHQPDSRQNPRPGSPDERSTGVYNTASLIANSLVNPGKAGSDNLHVALQSLVDRIDIAVDSEDGTSSASCVHVLDLRNRVRRRFTGKYIVLACGATESARLALTSGLDHELIGKGLTDHPAAEVHFSLPAAGWHFEATNGHQYSFGPNDQGNIFLQRYWTSDGNSGGPHPGRTGDTEASSWFSCELALNYKFWDVRLEDDQIWSERYSNPTTKSTIKFLFRNALNEQNSIKLTKTGYKVSMQPMTVDDDLKTEANQLAQRLLKFMQVSDATELTFDLEPVTYHMGGSLRMGTCPSTSVVDVDLKFHGFDNLFCCDLSVFPDIPASNPSLTLTALALRLARHLYQKNQDAAASTNNLYA